MIRVTHLSQSASTLGGGIPEAIRALMKAQSLAADQARMIAMVDEGEMTGEWVGGDPVLLPGQRLPGMTRVLGIDSELDRLLPELVHLHGLWSWFSVSVPRWAGRRKRPYVVSPHGMLDAWALANSRWKKVLAGHAFEWSNLRGASCLHALCVSEAESIRHYGLTNPVCVIPNGIDLPELTDNRSRPAGTSDHGPKVLLFLGRLHPKKGLVNAIRAWSEVRGQDEWQFVIAGWNQGGHEAELKRLCDELGLSYAEQSASDFVNLTPDHRPLAAVNFLGPAFGETKDALLRRADAFILPSFSEGLPMSVLEAWSYRLPVLMTDHCNLPEGFAHDAALRIGTDVDSIAQGMRLLLRSPTSDLRSLGQNGRALVEQQFTWPQVAAQMKQVYEWVLGGGGRPDCVV